MHVVLVVLIVTWQHPNMMEKSCEVILPNYKTTNDQRCNLCFLTWTFKSFLFEYIVYQHYL